MVPCLDSAEPEAEAWLRIIAANPKTQAVDLPHAEETWHQELLDYMGNSKIEASEERWAKGRALWHNFDLQVPDMT